MQFSGLTFSRGCCELKDGSPVCPENNGMDDYEFNDGVNHGRYFRCNEDLCNIGPLEFELPGKTKYNWLLFKLSFQECSFFR